MTFAGIAVGVGLTVAAGASIYATTTQAGIANSQLSLAQDQQYKQDQSFQQLQQLMQNPSAFFSSSIYQDSAAQGSAAVARQNAAQFGANSGNEATALQSFGQQYGFSQLQSQESLLAGMSGVGFNPTAAAGTASSAAGSAASGLSSLGGLLSFFGNSGGFGGGGGSTPTTGGVIGSGTPGYS